MEVQDSQYSFRDIAFSRCERNSSRRTQSAGTTNHLFSCFSANQILLEAGASNEVLVPTCSPCDSFRLDCKVRKVLIGKLQFDGVSKKYLCKWPLRKAIGGKRPACVDMPITTNSPVCEVILETEELPASVLTSSTRKKKRKRPSTNTNNIQASTIPCEISNENTKLREKLHSLNKQNIDLFRKIEKLQSEQEKLSHKQPSLTKAIGDVLLDRYGIRMDKKKVAEDVTNVIMEHTFLNGQCNLFLTRKKSNHRPGVTNQRTLATIIEEEYLSGRFKSGVHSTTKASHIFNELWSNNFLHGVLNKISKQKFIDEFKKECPYNQPEPVLRVMDLSGGVVNQSCINTLRGVENLKKYEQSEYLVSTNKLKKLQEKIHKKMKILCPYKLIENRDGIDGIEFEYSKLLKFLLKLFKLEQIARREGNVSISITLDGADLSRNIQHVTCGVKFCDPRAVNPLTGIPIGLEGVQSREFCFAFKILLAKDTKALYQSHFTSFFKWAQDLHEKGMDGGYKRFKVGSPQDISSFWKSIGRGGACKRDESFCHCCPLKSRDVIAPNITKCVDCVRRNNLECFHHPVGDKEYLAEIKDDLQGLINTHSHLFDDDKVSKMSLYLAPNDVFCKKKQATLILSHKMMMRG